ncbi:MAG: 6-phosphofructokinase [Candidatus Aenigmarchaeota archaeon]|nr:6-phosphofructokinase [Candidatus Aenigmarchaeota archaeon]
MKKMKIGVMTGGGDCPGLNAIIQAIVKKANDYKFEVVGFLDGYTGLVEGNAKTLTVDDVNDIYQDGGTIIGTSGANPFKLKDGQKKMLDTLEKFKIDVMIIVGGDGTLSSAKKLSGLGVNVICIPKTIDNDLSSTDYCIGFQSAVETAAEEISRLQTTAKSHDRVMIAELMGRSSGWLTLMSGLAGGAHIILVPEKEVDIDKVCKIIKKRRKLGKTYTVIAASEGINLKNCDIPLVASDERDESGNIRMVTRRVAEVLEKEIEKKTGISTRSVVLGHVQRGGSPVAFDINFGIRLGLSAVEMAKKKKFGYAVVIKGVKISSVKIEDVVEKTKVLDKKLLKLADFFSMM